MGKGKKFLSSFNTRSFRVGGYSVVATAIVLAIMIAANLLVNALPASVTKIDTTSLQLFTISEQTEKILKSVDKEVTLYWIVQAGQEDSTIQTLLERYDSASGNVTLKKVDPDVYPTFAQNYTDSLYNNSVLVECGDRYRYVDYYDIYLESFDYTEYSYVYDFDGENALTGAIDYVVSDNLPKIYILTGHGEELEDSVVETIENENIETEKLSLLTLDAVPEDADMLLICAPTSDISEKEAAMIRAYLEDGGNMLLVTDPPKDGPLTNLETIMAGYGVTTTEGIVAEANTSHYYYGNPFYLLPGISSHTITDSLIDGDYYVLLPVAQGLTINEDLLETVTITSLLSTTTSAYSKIAGWDLKVSEKEEGDIDGPFSLAVAVTDITSDTNIVWISSAQILNSSIDSTVSGGNTDFFMNTINWMCEHEERISIRSKRLESEYLTISSSSASTMTMLVVFIIPLTYLGVGIYVFIRRKHR